MTKKIIYCLLLIFITLSYTSCSKDEEEEAEYDKALLIGKWQEGTLYYRYDSNETGATWDTNDDISEEEAQKFKWTLERSTLTHIHIMEITGEAVVPKTYKVTQLNATTLSYKDINGGVSHTFTKVK